MLAAFVQRPIGHRLAGVMLVLPGLAPPSSTGRDRLELRQYAGGDQQLVGLAIQQVGITEHVFLKQLEHDQLDANLHPQAAPCLQEKLTKPRRAQGVFRVLQAPAEQFTQACVQLPQGQAITMPHPTEHRLQSHGFFHIIRAGAGCRLIRHQRHQVCTAAPGLAQVGERHKQLLHEHALEVLALEAQVAHGLEKNMMVDGATGLFGHFEQGVVGVIEQFLQALLQLLRSLVTHLQQHHRQARERRWRGLCPVDRHHLPVIVHPGLLKRRF